MCGGVIDKLVNEQNVEDSISFLKTELKKLLDEKFWIKIWLSRRVWRLL